MHKVFTKDEMYSINIYDRKTGSNESDIDNVVCELFIMKLVEPYEEDINIFSVYILSEDGVIEKWNGARNFICYNNVKEYSKQHYQYLTHLHLFSYHIYLCYTFHP